MDDLFPHWPPAWVDDHDIAADERVAVEGDVEFVSALRADDRVLLSVAWPGGKRYLLVDPVGNDAPQALRVGEVADDPQTARMIDALWSQALTLAKKLMDGDLELPTEPPERKSRLGRWRRGADQD
ncbi:hypothetical protein [Paraconexibacter sp.]|uniref:hypothetical protein n=1 Tax=Paraconexibacter sp. TaxID=2949640 RepID=UPI0035696C73